MEAEESKAVTGIAEAGSLVVKAPETKVVKTNGHEARLHRSQEMTDVEVAVGVVISLPFTTVLLRLL